MTPERWQQVERIYHSALGRTDELRAAYLQQACAGDDALRQEVESLLLRTLRTGEFSLSASVMPDLVGRRIQHYQILEKIGSGGMGVVYRARDDRLKRDVAVKMLSGLEDNTGHERDRILHEARACCALSHPGIVTVYDVCEAENRLFIVMELVRGQTLAELIMGGKLELAAVLRLAAQLSSALQAAHRAGILHGDIKPRNILIQPDFQAKLLDFGIARPDADVTLTMTRADAIANPFAGVVAGTPLYMAPEQLRGESIGPSADLYSLGVVLCEALFGEQSFRAGSSTGSPAAIFAGEGPELHITGDLNNRFAGIVRRLLEERPDARYSTAAELNREITNLQRDIDLAEYLKSDGAGTRTVAVLPFHLLTPGSDDEFLSIALADAVVNHLSSNSTLAVRSASSVASYMRKDPQIAGRELNVDFVVDGSIQKYGTQIRAHAQVRRVLDGQSLASLRLDSTTADLFGLQDRLGHSLLQALVPNPGGRSDSTSPTNNPRAFELYLRAGERLSGLNRWNIEQAVNLFAEATQLDPQFANAWARLAEACIQIAVMYENKPEWFARAEHAIAEALRLDPRDADAHCAEGQLLWTPQRNYANTAALRALNRALELNPGCQMAQNWRGLIYFHLGLHVEARRDLMAALTRNPSDARTLTLLGQTALYSGRYDEADDWDDRALATDPTNVWANLFYPQVALYRGLPERAMERVRLARQLLPEEATIDSAEALVWAHRGEMATATATLEQALERGKPLLHTHHMWHNAASVYAMGGAPEKAVHWLRAAGAMGLPDYPMFERDPHLRSLAGHPGFEQFMGEVKAEWREYRRQFGDPSVTESAQ